MTSHPPIALLGPTAAGKTAAALFIAEQTAVEIISVDSALVYRGLDIGTAKPSATEQSQVPHHLIDIRDPSDPYSAAAFVADAKRLIGEIQARGRLPLLVGGTMLYIKALSEGLSDLPVANAAIREQLSADAASEGWPALHARLASIDPSTAARLQPNDAQRIQRALEVWLVSGKPLSAWFADTAAAQPEPAARIPIIALEPSDRAALHARIAQRFDAMLAAGFLDEVRRLRDRGDLHAELPAIRAVGYRQAWAYWQAIETGQSTDHALNNLREQGIAATRQLAKRQLTWLRSMTVDARVDCLAGDALGQCLHAVIAANAQPASS